MALLASLHCNFQPEVVAYLTRRHRNVVIPAEDLPKCQVTTGLLIALRATAHITKFRINNDLVDVVIALDVHPWVTIPDTVSPEEQASAVMRCRNVLKNRIDDTLRKVTNHNAGGLGAGKDRAKMLFGGDPADISKCLNRLLAEKYVCMPNKSRKKRKRDDSTVIASSSSSSSPSPSPSPSSSVELVEAQDPAAK
jgi:hypothetical protein